MKNPYSGLRAALLVAVFFAFFSFQSASAAEINCGYWTSDAQSWTFDEDSVIWGKWSVRFTNKWATYSHSGSTEELPSESCSVNSAGDTCSVTYDKHGEFKVCKSPEVRSDVTPPTCGNWTITTAGQPIEYWSPGQDVTSLPWYWTPWGRTYSVRISDGQSGVFDDTVSYVWPSDSLEDPIMQSSLWDFARITVSDRAGNVTECVWPRKRVDGFTPPMPMLDCDNYINGVRPLSNPYQGEVKCGLSDSAGPSKTFVYYRIKTYNANLTTGAIGSLASDTNWVANGSFDTLIDVNGNRVRTGTAYQTNSAPLRYAFTPANNKITKIQGRLCEFVGTPGQRCTDSNEYEIQKIPAPPPIPETGGDGWYDCQNPGTGKIKWWSVDESVPWTDRTLYFTCSPDGVWAWEPRSRAKIWGTVASAGNAWCWCWDNEAPSISSITASPTTWTNQPVRFVWTAANTDTGWSPYGGIQYSCDNGANWSSWTTSTSVNFTCDTSSASAQVAKVRACDMAKNCSAAVSANFFIEKTAPTASSNGYFKIVGKKKNWDAHTQTSGETDSEQVTYKKDVVVHLDPSDNGGSWLKAIRLSCNSTFADDNWETWSAGAATKSVDLTDSNYDCGTSEGTKTLHLWAKDAAGNVSAPVSASIIYDKTAPDFATYGSSPILLRAIANYVYEIDSPNDGAQGSWFKDYSFTWIPENGAENSYPNIAATTPPFTNAFPNEAKYVNGSCDGNGDGKCVATLRITLEDKAGNAKTKEQRFEIISGPIASVAGDIKLIASRGNPGAMVADLYDRYTYAIHLEDANGNVVRPVPGILEIRGDWGFENNAFYLWNETTPLNGNEIDGSVWYNWDDGDWKSSQDGNSVSKLYRGATTRTEWNYNIQVRSSVPTKEWYAWLTKNTIKIKRLTFSNALETGNAEGCPSGYVCSGKNSNGTYGRSLWADLATNSNINGNLSFKPALEIVPSKQWNALSDGTWHDVTLAFKNNSTANSFTVTKYAFDFRYANYLWTFADFSVRGALGTDSKLAEWDSKKVSFFFTQWLPTVPKWTLDGSGNFTAGKVEKVISIRANSYGLWFGKIGFTGYLPWFMENNSICNETFCSPALSTTGYNTANLGIDSGVMAYDHLSSPISDDDFGTTESFGQKFAANGQVANSGNAWLQTLASWVAIETQTMDKAQFKANIRKNVETITRGVPSDNGNTCSVVVSNLTKDVTYYDFSKLEGTDVNGNKGCVVTLRGTDSGAASWFRKMGISGKKTLIIKWGNAYVDTDMYYADANSMLALVVLRDDGDRSKWGNVYVSPRVTNVVAAGYAEGSLMSYDANSNKVFDIGNTGEGELTRQLLWYGSLFSSNSVWGSMNSTTSWKCPYWSDTYERNKSESCSQAEASRYDFALMRRFLLIDADSPSACDVNGKTSPKSSGTSAEEYAFAGKKRCFQDDPNDVAELKSTSKTASFVMEYNPALSTSGIKVFAK